MTVLEFEERPERFPCVDGQVIRLNQAGKHAIFLLFYSGQILCCQAVLVIESYIRINVDLFIKNNRI